MLELLLEVLVDRDGVDQEYLVVSTLLALHGTCPVGQQQCLDTVKSSSGRNEVLTILEVDLVV